MRINIHTSHASAFISSTFIDLKNERYAVASVLKQSNLNINALDIKPASNNSSRKEIINGIKESDFIILIVGNRYGSMNSSITSKKSLSITRWEYEVAVKHVKKDVLVYFKEIESKDSIYYDDHTANDFKEKQKLLKKFKEELSRNHNPKYFSTTDELTEEVTKAIIPVYRTGVKTLITENDSLKKEITSLKSKIQNLNTTSNTTNSTITSGIIESVANPPLRGLQDVISGLKENKKEKDISGLAAAISRIDRKK